MVCCKGFYFHVARSTVEVALRLLKALQDEWEREPDFSKCRPIGVIAADICESQEEFDRVAKFLTADNLIRVVRRPDGLASRPSKAGLAWITKQAQEKSMNLNLGPDHMHAAMPLHKLIIIISGLLSALCIAGGIVAVIQNAKSKTEFELWGAHMTTGDVGVAFVGLGLIIGFFTVRAVLRSQGDLAKIPPHQRTIELNTRYSEHVPSAPVYTSRMEGPRKPSDMAFHVLKWFHNLGPQSLGNVAAVSMQCMISDQDALRCIKELHNDQLIRTVTHADGDWNGQYAITPQGRQCVERFGT